MKMDFGTTWWGKEWLRSLEGTDHLNRLARGRSYARNGSVFSFEIDPKTGIIEAKVRGHYASSYKITISFKKRFSEEETEKLITEIIKNPLIVSRLTTRELDPEINQIACKLGTPIFPKSMHDLNFNCTCPDFDNYSFDSNHVCKHIAAVIYTLSEQIDTNPFILFQMRNIELADELNKRGISMASAVEANIPNFETLITNDKADTSKEEVAEAKTTEDPFLNLEKLTFAKIEDVRESILGIFSDNPSGITDTNLKSTLDKITQIAAKIAKKLLKGDDEQEVMLPVFPEKKPFITINNGEISISEGANLAPLSQGSKASTIPIAKNFLNTSLNVPLCKIFNGSLNIGHFKKDNGNLIQLWRIWTLAARLTAKGAIIPEIFHAGKKGLQVRWKPATMIPNIAEITSDLGEYVEFNKNFVKVTPSLEDSTALQKGELYLSLFINAFINYAFRETVNLPKVIEMILFSCAPVKLNNSKESKLLEMRLENWLSPFVLSEGGYDPVITLTDPEENVTDEQQKDRDAPVIINLKFINDGNELSVDEAISENIPEKIRFSNMKTSAALTAFCPELGELIGKHLQEAQVPLDALADLLKKSLPILKLLGVNIVLPKSLKKLFSPKPIIKVSMKSSHGVESYFKLKDLLNFNWSIAIAGETITEEEFQELIDKAGQTIRFHDKFVYIDASDMQKLIKTMERQPKISKSALLLAVLAGSHDNIPVLLDPTVQECIKALKAERNLLPPKALNVDLRPYQRTGYSWMSQNIDTGIGSIIADDMGLGKTLQVLAVIERCREQGELEKNPVLAVVPTSLLMNWQKEASKFTPNIRVKLYYGSNRKIPEEPFDLLLTTYGTLRSLDDELMKMHFHILIIDEAQAVKNHSTSTSQAVRSVKADTVIAMSGTPVENSLREYWSIMDCVNPGLLGSLAFFSKEFQYPIEREHDPDAVKKFRAVTAPFIIRRLKTDKNVISDLPERIVRNEYCTLTKEQIALYKETVQAEIEKMENKEISNIKRSSIILETILRLKQICDAPTLFIKDSEATPDHSGKMERLFELIDNIREAGKKCLIFTQFKEMGTLIQKWLTDRYPDYLAPDFINGSVPVAKRSVITENFQKDPAHDILILSIKAAGTGLNLTAASAVIHYDLWWNPAVENQATDRAYRIGQKKDVVVHRFITANTFEEKIDEIIQKKKALSELTVAAGEKWITEMSNAEINNLLKISDH